MTEITYAFPKIKNIDPSCYIDAYSLVLECSNAHTPRGFASKLLELLGTMCPYDQAVVFFFDINRKVSGKYSIGTKSKTMDTFLDYYLDIVDSLPPQLSIYQDLDTIRDKLYSQIIDWDKLEDSRFKREYIEELGIKYSWGFCFFDLNGTARVAISLDRVKNKPFSETECTRLFLALPILNSMYMNFFYQGIDADENSVQSLWKEYKLTTREAEIASLLYQGMTVINISSVLYIAVTTTYKHISNIYEKIGVSSQQELLARVRSHGS